MQVVHTAFAPSFTLPCLMSELLATPRVGGRGRVVWRFGWAAPGPLLSSSSGGAAKRRCWLAGRRTTSS